MLLSLSRREKVNTSLRGLASKSKAVAMSLETEVEVASLLPGLGS